MYLGIPGLVGELHPGSVQAGVPCPADGRMVKWVGFMPEFIKPKAANPTYPDIVPKESQTLQV